MIDGHVHVWTLEPERYPWHQTLAHVPIPTTPATVEDLLSEMDASGVAHAVLVQPSVYGWNNAYLCDCLDRYPGRFVGVCLVDPHSEGAGDDLKFWCRDRGCRGVRINLIADRDVSWILGHTQQRIWDVAAELDVPVSLQMLPAHADAVAILLRQRSEVRFIIDYLGPDAFNDGSGARAFDVLAPRPNAYVKLLVVGQDSREKYPFRDLWPLYEHAVEALGVNRVLFGSDFPHVRSACPYPVAMCWPDDLPFLDDVARRAVTEGTARRLWPLDDDERRTR